MALINRSVTLPAQIWAAAEALAREVGLTPGDLYRDCMIDGLRLQAEKYKTLGLTEVPEGLNDSADSAEAFSADRPI